uniref:Sleeping Beauty transposase HTH domain-containing protein n=1 Tax=Oncorhynchus tshawytscha TaxID=74940 RepID=A0AAZ3SFY7_ONCTS
RSKGLSVELRNRIVSRHRPGEGYQNIYVALKVPKNTEPSVILKWKKLGTTKTHPRADHPGKLSNWSRRALVRGGDQELDGHSDRTPEFHCANGRTFQKDNHLCSIPPIRILWQSSQTEDTTQ